MHQQFLYQQFSLVLWKLKQSPNEIETKLISIPGDTLPMQSSIETRNFLKVHICLSELKRNSSHQWTNNFPTFQMLEKAAIVRGAPLLRLFDISRLTSPLSFLLMVFICCFRCWKASNEKSTTASYDFQFDSTNKVGVHSRMERERESEGGEGERDCRGNWSKCKR